MSGRPERRRASRLVGSHPAFPTPVPDPQPQAPMSGEEDRDRSHPVSRAQAGAAARTRTKSEADEQQAKARAAARDAAFAWGAAQRKLDRRAAAWAEAMRQARELGADPAMLREYVREAAERGGVEARDVPANVLRAAGLDPEPENGP